jgi:acyl-coenzyme A synthetase/AMP-(fatty) acid ligase
MRNNIGLYLGKRAHLNPDLEAAVDTATGRRLSYREIDAGANRVANGMRGLGIKKGDRVAILMMNSVEYVERFMGLAKIGAVAMIYGSNFAAVADTLQGRVAADTDIVHWIEFCEAGHVRDVFAMDYGDVVGHTSTEAPEIDSGDDDDLFIMYTSGTTGLPKGASPVPVSLIEKYQDIGIEIHQAYSLTEVGGPGTVLSPDEAMVRIGWAGKGFFHTSVRVVDGDGNVSH